MQTPELRKKPFVEPRLTEEASLEDVTLISGGGHGHGPNAKPKHNGPHGNNSSHQNGPQNTHGHGRNS